MCNTYVWYSEIFYFIYLYFSEKNYSYLKQIHTS